jgi:hypothetical protein
LYDFLFIAGLGEIMQLIEAALAFAITMLVLSLTCSSFVEILHRVFLMREAGLKYMLEQLFDQILARYVRPAIEEQQTSKIEKAVSDDPSVTAANKNAVIESRLKAEVDALLKTTRQGFLDQMTANRAPMGADPKATPSNGTGGTASNSWGFNLWGGRDLAAMNASEFMERLGSMDLGDLIKRANDAANAQAQQLGAAAADTVDAILKDLTQKFDAFGKEASTYFEGRARLLSVGVAIALAFAVRVDAIELFNTYLRDPNARNNVIEQTKAVTAQYQAAKDAAEALKTAGGNSGDATKQAEALQKDLQATIDATRATTKQYANLGLPIGWSNRNATLDPYAQTCSRNDSTRLLEDGKTCGSDETAGTVGWAAAIKLFFSLVLGGLLIGLGAPFWYNTVTGLTNIRSILGGDQKAGPGSAPAAKGSGSPAPAPATGTTAVPATSPDRPQPATPIGAFIVSQAARTAG